MVSCMRIWWKACMLCRTEPERVSGCRARWKRAAYSKNTFSSRVFVTKPALSSVRLELWL